MSNENREPVRFLRWNQFWGTYVDPATAPWEAETPEEPKGLAVVLHAVGLILAKKHGLVLRDARPIEHACDTLAYQLKFYHEGYERMLGQQFEVSDNLLRIPEALAKVFWDLDGNIAHSLANPPAWVTKE